MNTSAGCSEQAVEQLVDHRRRHARASPRRAPTRRGCRAARRRGGRCGWSGSAHRRGRRSPWRTPRSGRCRRPARCRRPSSDSTMSSQAASRAPALGPSASRSRRLIDLVAVRRRQLAHELPRAERSPLTVVRATVNNLRSTPLCDAEPATVCEIHAIFAQNVASVNRRSDGAGCRRGHRLASGHRTDAASTRCGRSSRDVLLSTRHGRCASARSGRRTVERLAIVLRAARSGLPLPSVLRPAIVDPRRRAAAFDDQRRRRPRRPRRRVRRHPRRRRRVLRPRRRGRRRGRLRRRRRPPPRGHRHRPARGSGDGRQGGRLSPSRRRDVAGQRGDAGGVPHRSDSPTAAGWTMGSSRSSST